MHPESVILFRTCCFPLATTPSAILMALSGVIPSTGFASWSFHACQPVCSMLCKVFSTAAFIWEYSWTPDNRRAKPSAVKAIRRMFILRCRCFATRTIDVRENRVNLLPTISDNEVRALLPQLEVLPSPLPSLGYDEGLQAHPIHWRQFFGHPQMRSPRSE